MCVSDHDVDASPTRPPAPGEQNEHLITLLEEPFGLKDDAVEHCGVILAERLDCFPSPKRPSIESAFGC